jgi:tRNA modification GTPase
MLQGLDDTIVAIATAPGRGAIGVVRVSGPALTAIMQAVCGRVLEARRASYLPLLDVHGQAIDRGLAIYFRAPHSYTGEDVLELQAHGGPVVLQLLLARCLEAGAGVGARLALPGEFTQRAFVNGKLDLAQAEAVSDLIDAGTEAAARSAARSLTGHFSDEIKRLANQLVELRTLVEATLDFPDEEIDFLEKADARGRMAAIAAALVAVLSRARQGALLREGIKVVLAGQPNVGKSSLLNALAGVELAIVTPLAGTTRDKVSETIQIDGIPIHVTDTAGLRDSNDEIERLGIARTWQAVADADLVLFLHDLTRTAEPAYANAESQLAMELAKALGGHERLLHVYNKADVTGQGPPPEGVLISALTGLGLQALRQAVLSFVGGEMLPEGLCIARSRHVHALQRAAQHLDLAMGHATRVDAAIDLLAEELRLAHNALGEITGSFTPDDLLGQIFGRFCIGK